MSEFDGRALPHLKNDKLVDFVPALQPFLILFQRQTLLGPCTL